MKLEKDTPNETELKRLEANGLIKAINKGRKGKKYDFAEGERHYDHNGKPFKIIIKEA